jgi:dTDP-4-dehydrorhamnose reductase
MKIFITGGSGLLGQFLSIRLSVRHNVLTTYHYNSGNCKQFNSAKLDLSNPEEIKKTFDAFLPDAVIHTAAYSRPEICDTHSREEVFNVNVKATEQLSKLCKNYNSLLVFTSTDLVYGGNTGSVLKEGAKLNPVSLYAESKLEAEKSIQNIFDNYIILRTSLLYGIGQNDSVNNFHKMYNNFKLGKPVKLFYDQFRTPLSLIDASRIVENILNLRIRGEIINFGGKQRVSRVELGEMLCDISGFDKSLIERISMDDVPGLQKVPDVSLNTDKLRSYGIEQKSIEESIYETLKFANG